jgi:hypothetical protein
MHANSIILLVEDIPRFVPELVIVVHHILLLVYFLDEIMFVLSKLAVGVAQEETVLKLLALSICFIQPVLFVKPLDAGPQHVHVLLRVLEIRDLVQRDWTDEFAVWDNLGWLHALLA